MLNRIAPRERSSINWPISYPWRARSSSSARIINSALPFFNSRSGTGDDIYCNAIYSARMDVNCRVGRPLLWAPLLRRVPTHRDPRYLFVRDGGAGWARKMDDFEAFEADFAAPFFEIGGGVIERVAEFDQHV